jgi:hypothetical protein
MNKQILIVINEFSRYWTGEKIEYNGTVHQLFINSRKPTIWLGGKYHTVFSLSLEYQGN